MNRRSTAAVLAAAIVTLLTIPNEVQAQDKSYARYAPYTGLVYRIKESKTLQKCLPQHVEFSWSDSVGAGAQGPAGPQGPEGPQGPMGPKGDSGSGGALQVTLHMEVVTILGEDRTHRVLCGPGQAVINFGYEAGFHVDPTMSISRPFIEGDQMGWEVRTPGQGTWRFTWGCTPAVVSAASTVARR